MPPTNDPGPTTDEAAEAPATGTDITGTEERPIVPLEDQKGEPVSERDGATQTIHPGEVKTTQNPASESGAATEEHPATVPNSDEKAANQK